MNTAHLEPLKKQLAALELVPPPAPWHPVATLAVGGLRAVGFDRTSELLLVVSSAGRGVIDCTNGAKVARDDEEYFEGEEFLEASGIGPLQDKIIRMSGLLGGGLPVTTPDGWTVEVLTLEWPIREVILLEPYAFLYGSLYGKPPILRKVGSSSELRACGFSYTGRSLIVATSSDVTVFGRNGG